MCRSLLDAADLFQLNPVREAEQCGQNQLRTPKKASDGASIMFDTQGARCTVLHCSRARCTVLHWATSARHSQTKTHLRVLSRTHAHTHTLTHAHTHTHTHHTRTHTRNRLHCNPLHLLHCSRDAALYCTILNCFWEASAHNTAFTGARYCITVYCDGGPRLQSSNLAIECSVLDLSLIHI